MCRNQSGRGVAGGRIAGMRWLIIGDAGRCNHVCWVGGIGLDKAGFRMLFAFVSLDNLCR